MLKDNVGPARGPRRVDRLEVGGLEAGEGRVVEARELVQRLHGAVDHGAEHGVPRGGGDGPLAELEVVGDLNPARAAQPVELNADDNARVPMVLLGHPEVYRLQRDGVNVGVDAALAEQQQVAQDIRLQAVLR